MEEVAAVMELVLMGSMLVALVRFDQIVNHPGQIEEMTKAEQGLTRCLQLCKSTLDKLA